MRSCGKYDPIESEYDLDHKINEIEFLTEKHIKELIAEVGQEDFNKIAKVIIPLYLDAIK